MLTVEVYAENQTGTGDPIAVLAYSGKGNKVTVKTSNVTVKDELTVFLQTVLSFPKQGRIAPDNRTQWMESLPRANVSVPYWFKVIDATDEIIEEVDNDNEDIEEDNGEDSADGGEEQDEGSPNNKDGGFLSTNG